MLVEDCNKLFVVVEDRLVVPSTIGSGVGRTEALPLLVVEIGLLMGGRTAVTTAWLWVFCASEDSVLAGREAALTVADTTTVDG